MSPRNLVERRICLRSIWLFVLAAGLAGATKPASPVTIRSFDRRNSTDIWMAPPEALGLCGTHSGTLNPTVVAFVAVPPTTRTYGLRAAPPLAVRPILRNHFPILIPATRGAIRDRAQEGVNGLWRDLDGNLWCGGVCGLGQQCCSISVGEGASPRPSPPAPPPPPPPTTNGRPKGEDE